VADFVENPLGRPRPSFYLPLSSQASTVSTHLFLVKVSGAPAAVVPAVRERLMTLDRASTVRAMRSIVEGAASEIAVTIFPMTPLVAIGILLTASGIYGILAFAITRRSKELAIRIAVGAGTADLLRLVARLGFRLVGTGIFLGVGLTFGLSRFIQGAGGVFDSPRWPVFAVPVFIILAVGVLAACVPSRRAISLDPAVLLRME
jgi:ABC-type antimicrobial peptide transport system permease subunit